MSIPLIITASALAQWMVVACIHLFSRRPQRLVLIASTAIFALTSAVVFGVVLRKKESPSAVNASTSANGIGCAAVEKGMTAAAAEAKAGKPDEKRSDEDTRGPGATIWVYRDARCQVHLMRDHVEFVE